MTFQFYFTTLVEIQARRCNTNNPKYYWQFQAHLQSLRSTRKSVETINKVDEAASR